MDETPDDGKGKAVPFALSSFDRLSLRGVRSFSPEEEEQTIDFYCPCTIIVGANGCGKTTIIESLKYAVSGSFPPGNKSGQAFVHDPRSLGVNQVKAYVKLRFKSRNGQDMVVVRTMELTQKKTTMSFKQLDGALRVFNPETGRRETFSHKCAELDKHVGAVIGVSKAVLEHVVFCHQEDASWPLQEGAVLKKRLDDIFDSAKYTKSLDFVSKTEKEMSAKVKDLKIELAALNSAKNAADLFVQDMHKYEEALEEIEDEKQVIQESLGRATAETAELEQIQGEMDQVDLRLTKAKSELFRVTQSQQAARKFLEHDMSMDHSKDDLEQQLTDFGDKMADQVNRQKELLAKHKAMELDIEKLRQQEVDLTSSLGKLTAEREAHEKRMVDRYKMMESIAQTYSIDLQGSQFSQGPNVSFSAATLTAGVSQNDDAELAAGITVEDMQGFFVALEGKGDEMAANVKEHKADTQAKDDAFQKEISAISSKLDVIEAERTKLSQRRSKVQEELASINAKLSGPNRYRTSDIEEAKKHLRNFTKQRDEANQNPRRKEIPVEITQLQNKIETLKSSITNDKMVVQQMRSNAGLHNEVSMLRDQCRKELEILHESMMDQALKLENHGIEIDVSLPDEEDDKDGDELQEKVQSINETVMDKVTQLNSNFRRMAEDLAKTQEVVSEKSALLSSSQRNLHTMTMDIDGLSNRVNDARKVIDEIRSYELSQNRVLKGDENNPGELVKYLDQRLTEVEENAPIKNEAVVIKKVIKKIYKLAQKNSSHGGKLHCPCCSTDIGGKESGEFALRIQKLEHDLLQETASKSKEAKAQQYETDLAVYQNWKKQITSSMEFLLDSKRLKEESKQVQDRVNMLDREQKQYREKLSKDKKNVNTTEAKLNEFRALLEGTKRWLDDVGRIVGKRANIQQKLDFLTTATDHNGQDLESMERELAQKVEQKDANMMKINDLNSEMSTLNNIIHDWTTKATNMERNLREKEAKFAESEKAKKRKDELTDEFRSINSKEKEVQDNIVPLKQKLHSKENLKRQFRASANAQEAELQEGLNGFQGEVTQLKDVSRQIDEFASNPRNDEKGISNKATKIVQRREKRKKEIDSLKIELGQVTSAVDDQERHKKQLEANIEVLEANSRINELKESVASLEDEMSKIEGGDSVSEKLSEAASRAEENRVALARVEGRWHEVVEQIRSVKRKLSSAEYKDIGNRFSTATLDVETTQIAAKDMKKYGTALDKSILQFHHNTIKEINKRIRELWMLTYKGEDISTIALVSGQEAGSKASKSYNYRVVMTKGTTQLDMRGRCSAGQRVLASIVIRLALAETFCVNCGCIALDEPTVNLDERTKDGLAVALGQIVASRSRQRNFQLILITHDEHFVGRMRTELSAHSGFSMPENIFQVHREMAADGKYYSKIRAVPWDEPL